MNKEVCMLTTFDNPYNPFEQFDSWFLFDVENGYYTCSRLARITKLRDDMTEKEIDEEIERAMTTIIDNDFLNIYKKIKKSDKISSESIKKQIEEVNKGL